MTATVPELRPETQAFLAGPPKQLIVGGRHQDAQSGRKFKTLNPATGELLAWVCEGGKEDVDLAVEAARRAVDGAWGRVTPSERGRILWRAADLIEKHADELAELETLDNGKTIRESRRGDLIMAVDLFRYYAGFATKIHGETLPVSMPYAPKLRFFSYTVREPVGVVGVILPWNFPLVMMAERVAPALACGNSVVVKPAEQTPLTALRLGDLLLEAGVPGEAVSVIPGFGPSAGAALAGHPGVDKLSFTGSTEIGREIVRQSTGNLKRLSLELGGKAPNIIFADADLEAAVKGAMMGIFYNQGQCCSAGARVYVERSVFKDVQDALAAHAQTLRVGPGLDPQSQMGPLVSQDQLNRVAGYVKKGLEEGARCLTGGHARDGGGYFFDPTVFAEATDRMAIAREEIFGPVVVVMPFDQTEEVVKRANDTPYGLVAGVWTKDMKKAFRVAEAVRAGTVWVNCYNFVDSATPWGGFKQSGYGREKGPYAIEEYTSLKNVWIDLNDAPPKKR